MDTDLRDELDRCFGDGPEHRPLDRALAAGRRDLRRRRAGWVAGGVAAAALVVAAGSWQAASLPGAGTPPVATPGEDQGPGTGLWRDLDPVPQFELDENQVFYDSDGTLVVRPEATVEQRVAAPRPAAFAARATALITRMAGRTYWSYAYWRTDGSAGSSSVRPEDAHGATFGAWVASEAARMAVDDIEPAYVRLGADGTVDAVAGATVVEQTDDVPERIAPAGSTAAVALVDTGAAVVCAYARTVGDHQPEYLYLNGAELGGDLAGCVANLDGWDRRALD